MDAALELGEREQRTLIGANRDMVVEVLPARIAPRVPPDRVVHLRDRRQEREGQGRGRLARAADDSQDLLLEAGGTSRRVEGTARITGDGEAPGRRAPPTVERLLRILAAERQL